MDFMATLLQQLRLRNCISRVVLFGCALALATIVSPQEALAQTTPNTTTICKQTIPSGSTTMFTFTGNNGRTGSLSFNSVKDEGPIPPLQDSTHAPSNCWTFHQQLSDQSDAITETVPPGWALTNISCTGSGFIRFDVGQGPPPIKPTQAFQPGDNTVRIDGGSQTCTFVNQQTGSLTVGKEIGESVGPVTSFPMMVTCTNPPITYSFSLLGNTISPPTDLPVGSNCSVTETVPGPFIFNNEICTWQTPKYSPTNVAIVSGMNTLLVTNTVKCVPAGPLTVTKVVSPDPKGIAGTLSFPMTVTCTPFGSGSVTVVGNTSAAPMYLPVGSNCTIAETQPRLPHDCVWLPPQYSPPSVTITSGANVETVTNNYFCREGPTGSLTITKIVSPDPLENGGFLSFPMTVTCTPSGGGSVTVVGNTNSTVLNNLPVGSKCPVAETPPQLPAGCAWLAPQYSSQPVTIAAGTNNETIINGYKCDTGGGQMFGVCPSGTVQKGRECVPRIDCREPMIPNAAGTTCVCPAGTVQQGRSCVQPTVCNPPAKLNRRGACQCPTDMVARGNTCVEREHKPQAIAPERFPGIGIPGTGPRGRPEGPGGPGGGNQGGSPGRR